jgi:N,N-dimethylformamidase beta subunit-like, C-terminal
VNLAFFSGSTCYWQVRLEPSPLNGGANRTLVGYKAYAFNAANAFPSGDPYYLDTDPSNDKYITTSWRSAPLNSPEASLQGSQFQAEQVNGDIVITNGGHWALAGTGLANGDRLTGLLGFEVEGVVPGASPANTAVFAHSTYTSPPAVGPGIVDGTGFADMTTYVAPSGAIVFSSGSMQFTWGLDDFMITPGIRAAVQSAQAQLIMKNVVDTLTN